ncbi:unnamed protein product [Phytomonas sp. Hart1]|nr:unnamed protein product [Phytomonas sp. Hart1]|eukprot:CCW68396.1 unnamed protein product [Phytomonas sp. isolate Hart1]
MGDTYSVKSHVLTRAESDELEVALQCLCAKLKASQPIFTEEDVTFIPFLNDSCSSSTQPPSNLWGLPNICEVEDFTTGQFDLNKNGEMCSLPSDEAKRSATKLSSSSHLGSISCRSIETPLNGTINLDNPLSIGLFLASVNMFEPKLITKSRKVALDAVKLVKQGYALVYRDPHFVFHSQSKCEAHSLVSDAIAVMPSGESIIQKSKPLARTSCVVNTMGYPKPSYKPDPALILYLDQSIQALLVYCNDSTTLSQFISSNQSILGLFAFVCSMSRRAEEGVVNGAEDVPGARDVNAELEELKSHWSSCGLVGRVVNYLQECYLIEFLLDDALPPAVCSSRYEGLTDALCDKKRKITLNILLNCHKLSSMVHMSPLKGLVGIIKMFAFTGVRQQARFLDRITAEGLMERLLKELKDVWLDLFPPLGSVHNIECLYVCSQTVSNSTFDNTSIHNQIDGNSSSSKRKVSTPPITSDFQTRNNLNYTSKVVECLGYCADILLIITNLNLRSALETDEMMKTPRTASTAVVRSTLWASQDATLHEMVAILLRIACFNFHNQQNSISLLRSYIMDCVLQIAVHSDPLYNMVVDAINALFEDFQLNEAGWGPQNLSSHPILTMNWTTAPEPTTINAVNGLKYLKNFTPLLSLLVGLLAQTNHAQVHAVSIRRWFWYLSTNLLPDAFEVPSLISGRKSTVAWGRQLMKRSQPVTKNLMTKNVLPWTAVMLARNLRRDEMISLLPYFTFACRVIRETIWRDDSEVFFAKIISLSYHVMMVNARQCNLCFGQAFSCYKLMSIILSEREMGFTKDTKLEGINSIINNTPVKESPPTPKNTPNESSDVKKRSRSVAAVEDESLQLFIPSPKHGSTSYETSSPDLLDSEFQDCIENDDLISDSYENNFASLSRSDDGAYEVVEKTGDESPQGVLTQPWHLLHKVLLLPNRGLNNSKETLEDLAQKNHRQPKL